MVSNTTGKEKRNKSSSKQKEAPTAVISKIQKNDVSVENLYSSSADDKSALRFSISDLYELGATLRNEYPYIAPTITTSSLQRQKTGDAADESSNQNDKKGSKKKPKHIVTASLASLASPGSESISTDQIWGQLSLLGAPILHEIGANITRLTVACGVTSKKGKKNKKGGISFADEDEDDDGIDDDDIDILAEEDEEDDLDADEEDFDEEGEDEEGDDEDLLDSDDGDDEESLLGDDPALARIIASRKSKQNAKKSAKDLMEEKRQKALLDFAAGAEDDDGENDEDDWAAEFETRKDRGGNDDDEDDGRHDDNRGPALSKRAERLKKKYGSSSSNNEDELGDFGDEDGKGLGGLYGDDEGGEEDEEEDEEDADIMAEMYGEDYEGDDSKFLGEDEEDDDVHGTSDAEGEDGEDGGLYDADEDARFQKGMFPTDDDDGFDNILDDREGYFGADGAHKAGGEADDDDEDEDGLTDFQLRQKQEKKFIKTLEEKRAFNADWSMAGEVEGRARPKDSLVDEELDFEHGMKSVPVITEALTAKLEERIKQRILDNNYDDVVRRQAATSAADLSSLGVAKRDTTTDAEKSKASLMDLYEKDYLAKLKKMEDAAGMNENIAEPLTEIEKDELKAIQMWKRLAQHLDALSNYYFTPKPVQEDLNVRIRAVDKAAPAITMESVGAFAVSKASAIAPQDTFRPAQKSMLGNVSLEEMTPRERQALRRAKKDASAVTKARIEKKVAEKAVKKRRVETPQ